MATLSNPKGISSRTVIDVPDKWDAEWFRRFIRTQLSQADVRNATGGIGISITGNPTTPATVSVSTDLQALFHQSYVMAVAPSGISTAFDTYRLLAPQAGVLTVADGGVRANITVGVATNGIGNTQLRQGVAKSVIGNATNVASNVADIISTANGDVLWNNGGTSISFGPLTFLGTVTTGTWNATVVAAPFGGTGQNAYAVGDLLYASAANALSRLADVAVGSYLRSGGVGAAPVWSTVTLPNAAALGDIMYASAANTYADLAGNTTTAKLFLTQTGTGSASTAPGWNTIVAGDLPGSFSGFANPTAKVALAAINGVATTAMRSDAAPALDQTIAPTMSGVWTFSAASTAFGGTPSGFVVSPNFSFQQSGTVNVGIRDTTDGVEALFRCDSTGVIFGAISNHSLFVRTNNANRVTITGAGNITAAAPTSGDTVTVSNVSGGNAVVVTGNSAGTAVVRLNTQATTGAQTATFTATNKPGVANGSPQKWLPVNADGTTYYVPLFS